MARNEARNRFQGRKLHRRPVERGASARSGLCRLCSCTCGRTQCGWTRGTAEEEETRWTAANSTQQLASLCSGHDVHLPDTTRARTMCRRQTWHHCFVPFTAEIMESVQHYRRNWLRRAACPLKYVKVVPAGRSPGNSQSAVEREN